MKAFFPALLAPLTAHEFFGRYWLKESVSVHRGDASFYRDILSVDALDLLLRNLNLPAVFFNVVERGAGKPLADWSHLQDAARGECQVADIERLLALYNKGATLILNQAHRVIPSVTDACRALTRELGFKVGSNIYITPPTAQGFGRHCDGHEVIVLQVAGEKRFTVHPEGRKSVHIEMRPGDLLYLPRGLFHEACSQDKPSVHLSLGLHVRYAFDLARDLADAAQRHPAFQSVVPTPFHGTDTRRAFHEEFAANLEAMIKTRTAETAADEWGETLIEGQYAGWDGRLSDLLNVPALSLSSIVVARSGAATDLRIEGTQAVARFGPHRVTAPAILKTCMERILQPPPFAIGELKGLISDSGKIELVQSFVRAGLVRVVSL